MTISIKRLSTRDLRENLPIIRKRLWEVNIPPFLRVVILKVSKNYELIYFKHIAGSRLIRESRLCAADHFIDLPSLRLSIIAWRGVEATKEFKKAKNKNKLDLINNIIAYLYRLNSKSQTTISENLENYRYINLFINELGELNKEKAVKRKIKYLFSKLSPTIVGPGLEDPVLSNFTIYKNELCLVDLDNFSEAINFFYEIGFLLADLEIDHKFEQTKLKKLWKLCQKKMGVTPKNDDRSRLLFGYISRYVILYLNTRKNPRFDYGYDSNKVLKYIHHCLSSFSY
jgi:hypothetical protein